MKSVSSAVNKKKRPKTTSPSRLFLKKAFCFFTDTEPSLASVEIRGSCWGFEGYGSRSGFLISSAQEDFANPLTLPQRVQRKVSTRLIQSGEACGWPKRRSALVSAIFTRLICKSCSPHIFL